MSQIDDPWPNDYGMMNDPDIADRDCDDDEDRDWDEALDECGLLPPHLGGGCQLSGTEHCDFECPFRDNSPFEEEEE